MDILISANSSGFLTLELPRYFNNYNDENKKDGEYGVFLYPPIQFKKSGGDFVSDFAIVDVDELKNNHKSRTIAIEFLNDTQYIGIDFKMDNSVIEGVLDTHLQLS